MNWFIVSWKLKIQAMDSYNS